MEYAFIGEEWDPVATRGVLPTDWWNLNWQPMPYLQRLKAIDNNSKFLGSSAPVGEPCSQYVHARLVCSIPREPCSRCVVSCQL